jgi:hypothetical protein
VKTREGALKTVKRVFKYLCDALDYAIFYQGRPSHREIGIQGFVDVEGVGYIDCKRSRNGYVFNLFG